LCGQILEGKQKQENILPMLFLMDENDNIEPLKNDDGELKINPNWYKSNPSLGITYDKELILEDYIKSKNENNMNNFLTKSLNIYTNASTNWIPDKIVSKNFLNYDITFFKNKKVNIGIDLSINTDFSVINLITEVDQKYYSYPIFHFVDNEKTKITNYNVKKFINSGLVTKHKNSIDIDIIFNNLIKLLSDNQIEVNKIYYDKFNASVLAQKMFDINLNIEHFQQTIFRYNLPTKQTEKMIFDGDLYFPENHKDIIKHSFNNVVIIADANNNIKPAKNKSKGTIDYIVSLIMAIDGYNNTFDFSDLSSLYD
ncbi:MAG: terminase TerL endonuclease subunit, partial [bacterium]